MIEFFRIYPWIRLHPELPNRLAVVSEEFGDHLSPTETGNALTPEVGTLSRSQKRRLRKKKNLLEREHSLLTLEPSEQSRLGIPPSGQKATLSLLEIDSPGSRTTPVNDKGVSELSRILGVKPEELFITSLPLDLARDWLRDTEEAACCRNPEILPSKGRDSSRKRIFRFFGSKPASSESREANPGLKPKERRI